MSGGGGGGDSTQRSYVRTVPDWAVPDVTAYAQAAYDIWKLGIVSGYAGDVVADQAPDELEGITGLAIRGRYGDQVITKAIAYLEGVINGEYLPGTRTEFLIALGNVTGESTTAFADVNSRIGKKSYYVGDPDSSLLAQTLAAPFPATFNAREEAKIYAENFMKERAIQQHGLGFGVEMGKHAAIDAEALRRAGLYVREYEQGTYANLYKQFVEGQQAEVANLEVFGNALRALTGSSMTTTSGISGGPNQFMSAVGGALAGAMIGNMIVPGVGAIFGGIIGGIAGWLF